MNKMIKSLISIPLSCSLLLSGISLKQAYADNYYIKLLDNYPSHVQPAGYPNCWASVLYTMYTYCSGNSTVIEYIYNVFINVNNTYNVNNGATLQQCYNVIDYLFPSYNTQYYYSAMSQNEIRGQIDSNYSAFIAGVQTYGTAGHAVALKGYKKGIFDNTIYRIYYMDPQDGQTRSYSYQDGSYTKFQDANGIEYDWYGSITIL